MSTALSDDATKGHADLLELAKRAVEASYDLDQDNPATLLKLIDVYAIAGDQAKVNEFGPKAVGRGESRGGGRP